MTSLLEAVHSGLLSASESALENAGLVVPTRSSVWHQRPVVAWPAGSQDEAGDGQLAVYNEGFAARGYGERRAASPGEAQAAGYHTVLAARVELWGLWPGLNDNESEPEPADVTEAAQKLARGAWAIWCELCQRRDARTLVTLDEIGMAVSREDIGIGSATPVAPSGNAAGWKINVEVALAAVFG